VQYGGGGFNGVLITGVGLPPAAPSTAPRTLAKRNCDLRQPTRPRNQAGPAAQLFAANDEAFLNFAHVPTKKVRDAAVMLIDRAYAPGPRSCISSAVRRAGARPDHGATVPCDFDGIFRTAFP